ncbi:MAG TPA: methionyl-tRNA formyltransferase [Chthoniobacterales bacterium]|nr:methionyl-tRNA formyltransferase [Chthoniobacterales bacterium]
MRVVFIGTGEIGLPVLRWLRQSSEHELVAVVTQPDKPVGRAQRSEAPPIKAALAGQTVPVLQPIKIRADDSVAQIRDFSPDVIVVMAYGQILPPSLLEIPRIACLNLHASLLPKHRGAAPIQAAIVHGDEETGITVMYMDAGLDTGDMLLQKRIPITPDETGGSLHGRLAEIAPAALEEGLDQIANGSAPRTPQDASIATYAPKLEREHGRIDWNESAALIERKVRAFDPWPGAFAVLHDEAGRERKLKVFRARVVDSCSADPANLVIPTKVGALKLDEVQLDGKRRMSAAEFLRGYNAVLRLR